MAERKTYSAWSTGLKKMAVDLPAEQVNIVIRKLALEGLKRVVLRSPVGNPDLWKHKPPPGSGYVGGHFRNNWFIDIKVVEPKTRVKIDASGSDSMNEMSRLGPLKSNPFQAIYIHNSLPYATRLERGHSTQAPLGIVGLTAQELSSIVIQLGGYNVSGKY